jgi:hypothetical protein
VWLIPVGLAISWLAPFLNHVSFLFGLLFCCSFVILRVFVIFGADG